jgi:hypothetical protein
MPRGCRLACHSGRASGETGSATQMCARRPTATGPGHSRARCGASPARARCAAPGDRAESPRRRSRDHQAHRVGTPPRPAAFALEQWNRINQWQGFLRVIPVRAGEADGEGYALPVADQMTLAPPLGSVGGIGRRSACPQTQRARSNYPRPLATNQSGLFERANPAARSASDPKCRPLANRASAASTSSQNRSRVPAATSAKECHCEGRRQCR